eukprot:g48905.t1
MADEQEDYDDNEDSGEVMDAQGFIQSVIEETMQEAMKQHLHSLTKACFLKCVHSPGMRLTNQSRSCLASCCDRQLHLRGLILHTVQSER